MAGVVQQYVHDKTRPPPLQTALSPPWTSPARLTKSSLEQLAGHADQEEDQTTPVSPMMSRRTSFDSDRFSTVSGLTSYFPSNPTNVNPKAQYVAPFGASQVVSEHLSAKRHSSSEDEDDEKLNKDDVRFSEGALALVNTFLDQLLYSFLSTARSTSLLALRPAVTEVLKHRLARDAITSAEEELAELLAGGDDEEEDKKHKTAEENRHWDLELVWKRTRLRVMVYMRLGEMEDEDEQRYVKDEELFQGNERRFSQSSGLVSWAAAIFLTSVLEFIAEQTLQVAGKASYNRARRQSRTERLAGATNVERSDVLVVEEYDVEKIALNSTLGRLWRTWRKALRNNAAANGTPTYRSSGSNNPISRDTMVSALSHRRSSFGTAHEGSVMTESRPASRDQKDDVADMEYHEHVLAANIPLPIGDNTKDIDEIVVPGLAADPDVDGEERPGTDEPYSGDLLGSLMTLPMGDAKRDLDEIEVPGLARDPDEPDEPDAADRTAEEATPARRLSLTEPLFHRLRAAFTGPKESSSSSKNHGTPKLTRMRSMSQPTPVRTQIPPTYGRADVDGTALEASVLSDAAREPDGQEDPQAQSSPPPLSEEESGEMPVQSRGLDHKEGSESFPLMVGGASVATVVVGAAAAVVGALTGTATESQPSASSVTQSRSTSPHGVGLTDNLGHSNFSEEEQNPSGSLLASTEHQPQRSYSDQEIEELDRRKSLIDIKAMMIVNSPSGPASGQQSPQTEEPSFLAPETVSDGAGSISEEEGPDDGIGVAWTADVPSNVIPRMSEAQQAREAPKRPTRLVLENTPPEEALDSPTIKQPTSPSTTQRQLPDLTSKTDQTQASAQRSPSNVSNRANLANGAQQPLAVEKAPHRQSLTADVEKNIAVPQRARSSKGLGQKMSGSKGNEPKSPKAPKSPRPVGDSESLHVMTSASIRGPEDFDMFLQGADTVKYTLTPDTVRDDAPWSSAPHPQSRQPPVEMDATSISTTSDGRIGRSQASKQATPTYTTAGAVEDEDQQSRRRSISKPSPRNASTHRKSGLMAREPRVLTNSTRDFADFIRSTGPQKEKPVVPLLANASQTSLHSLRSAHIHGASASRSSSPTGDRSRSNTLNDGAPEVPPVPPITLQPKQSMQPRPAKAITAGSSELIDFIRTGPDQYGQHRISRSVAPFRTTMDSDQLRDLTDRTSTERSSDVRQPANSASLKTPSMRSSQRTSVNSRSALLNGVGNGSQAVQPVRNNQQPRLATPYENNSASGVSQENEPTRKRNRNKDPYNMDFLNDDDDDWFATPPKSSRGESLVDFLNNNAPPTNTAPRPLLDVNSPQARDALSRMTSTSTNGQQNSADPRVRSMAPSVLNSSAQSVSSGRQAKPPKMMPRGGTKDVAANSNIQDLADFFKSSGPDEEDSAPAPFVGRTVRPSAKDEKAKKKAEKRSVGGFFSSMRRTPRKTTYIDMP